MDKEKWETVVDDMIAGIDDRPESLIELLRPHHENMAEALWQQFINDVDLEVMSDAQYRVMRACYIGGQFDGQRWIKDIMTVYNLDSGSKLVDAYHADTGSAVISVRLGALSDTDSEED